MPTRFIFDERFVAAFAHAEHRVIGVALRPFSSWHELNLQLINSPILTGEPCAWHDVIAAVRICATEYRTGDPTPRLAARGWRERLRWRWRLYRADLKKELEALGRYLEDFRTGPKFWQNNHKNEGANVEGDRDREFDEILEAVAFVWRETGCGEERAWNMPIGSLRWYCAQFSRWNSNSKDRMIWTPADEAAFAEHKKRKEKTLQQWAQEIAAREHISPDEARKKAEAEWNRRTAAFFAATRDGAPEMRVVDKPRPAKPAGPAQPAPRQTPPKAARTQRNRPR